MSRRNARGLSSSNPIMSNSNQISFSKNSPRSAERVRLAFDRFLRSLARSWSPSLSIRSLKDMAADDLHWDYDLDPFRSGLRLEAVSLSNGFRITSILLDHNAVFPTQGVQRAVWSDTLWTNVHLPPSTAAPDRRDVRLFASEFFITLRLNSRPEGGR